MIKKLNFLNYKKINNLEQREYIIIYLNFQYYLTCMIISLVGSN